MLSFMDSCREIGRVIARYAGGTPALLLLSIAGGIYLLVVSRPFRRRLLAPIIALAVIVLNPVLYSLVYGNTNLPFVSSYGLRYWRFFWLLPQGILIAAAATHLIGRMKRPLARCLGLVAATALILLAGKNIFLVEGAYKPAVSPYKMTRIVETVCEKVLADDPDPVCMFDNVISTQARAYSGHIRQLWGRDGSWSVFADPEAWAVYNLLEGRPREWEPIFAFAEQRGVTHISYVVRAKDDPDEMLAIAGRHGYETLEKIDKRIILHKLTR